MGHLFLFLIEEERKPLELIKSSYERQYTKIIEIIYKKQITGFMILNRVKDKRGKDIGIFSFLEDENFQFKKVWKIELKRISILILPIILLLFISIDTAMNYSKMIRYSNYLDTPFLDYMFLEKATSYTKRFIIDIILLIICYIYYYTQKLKYIIAFKISLDEPELLPKEVIEKSKNLMIGHRKEYFMLQFSFIGWEVLAYFTLGIGYLWLTPYIQISTICFYDKLKENSIEGNLNNK